MTYSIDAEIFGGRGRQMQIEAADGGENARPRGLARDATVSALPTEL
jgi:hypothetical protein